MLAAAAVGAETGLRAMEEHAPINTIQTPIATIKAFWRGMPQSIAEFFKAESENFKTLICSILL